MKLLERIKNVLNDIAVIPLMLVYLALTDDDEEVNDYAVQEKS